MGESEITILSGLDFLQEYGAVFLKTELFMLHDLQLGFRVDAGSVQSEQPICHSPLAHPMKNR